MCHIIPNLHVVAVELAVARVVVAAVSVSAAAAAAAAATPGDVHGDGAAPCHGKGVCERVSRV